jgi:hypothetical protein
MTREKAGEILAAKNPAEVVRLTRSSPLATQPTEMIVGLGMGEMIRMDAVER